MDRPPRARQAKLFGWRRLGWSLAQGALVLLSTILMVSAFRGAGVAEGALRAMAFACVAFGNVAILVANRRAPNAPARRETSRNPAVAILIGATMAALAIMLLVPPVREVFAFGPLTLLQAATVALLGAGPVALLALGRHALARARATSAASGSQVQTRS